MDNIVVVRGGGDLATGVIHKLHRCNIKVVVLECEQNMKRPTGRNPVKAISIQKSRKHGMRNRRNSTSVLSACCTLSD